jgi:hypothetical protein
MKKDLSFGKCYCYVSGTVNGIDIESEDFGSKYDHDREKAPMYGCGDMRFDPSPSTPEVLNKYSITEQEYDEICQELAEGLSFGRCGWCI